MSERIRIHKPDGSLLMELSDEDSRELSAKARRAGCSPHEWLSRRLKEEWAAIMRVN